MKHQHGIPTQQGISLSKQIARGTMVSAALQTSGKVMSKIVKNPAVVFGLGIVAGYFVYKYRKQIVSSANRTVGAGKDFVLQQKENLEDLVAEAKEE